MDLVAGWQSSIGEAVLESWGFAEEMCEAVRDQGDHTRKWKHQAELTDVMIAGIVLADAFRSPEPRRVAMGGINSFQSIGLTEQDCAAILTDAERQIRLVRDALGC
jgi:HD-like signal output (HDOD) protein